MKCSKCGNEMKSWVNQQTGKPMATCDTCHYDVEDFSYQQTVPPQPTPQAYNGVKCPRCGGNNLQAISDTHGKGASFWKLCCCGILGLCGTGKTKTEHYWVCQSCGNKFKM